MKPGVKLPHYAVKMARPASVAPSQQFSHISIENGAKRKGSVSEIDDAEDDACWQVKCPQYEGGHD